jgi:AcrR family transcriptional regulator
MMDRKWDPILKAAKMLFLEKSITSASMDEVAARAGATKRTVYNNFGSKERLVEAVFKEAASEFRATGPVLAKDADASGLASFAAHALVSLTTGYAIGFQRIVIAEGQQFPEQTAALLGDAFAVLIAPLAAWLAHHAMPESEAVAQAQRLIEDMSAEARLERLLGQRQPYANEPPYALDEKDQHAITRFVSQVMALDKTKPG